MLADLAKFCRAADSTYHTDNTVTYMLQGRREVWLRIQDHLNLSPEVLYQLQTGQPVEGQVQQVEVFDNDDRVQQ